MEGTQYRIKLNAPRREEEKWANIPISTWDIKARKKISSINLPCGTVLTAGPITQTVLQHLAHYGCSINITEHCSPIWTHGKAPRALNLWHHGTCLYGCKAQKASWKQVSAKGREGGAGQTSMRMVREEGPWKPLPMIGSSAFCVQNRLKKTPEHSFTAVIFDSPHLCAKLLRGKQNGILHLSWVIESHTRTFWIGLFMCGVFFKSHE